MAKLSSYKAFCALLLMLVMATSAMPALGQAQAGSGQIVGNITDAQGAALAGAKITAVNTGTGLTQTATTSDDGNFQIILLPPGMYKVTVEAAGFNKITADVEVTVGRTADLKLELKTGGVDEAITVTAGAVQVQTTRSEADSVINERAIENLPINGRRFQDFVTLTPSAQVDPQRGQISLSGQRGIYGANVNIDGVDYNQPFFGGIRGGERSNSAFTVPQESIKEFQVVAAGYSAEFGRSTGGIVNAVTKSGTNDFHGSAFYLIRPEELARSNDFFDALQIQVQPLQATPTSPPPFKREVVPAPTQSQFGGSFGGPLKKDKLFFFGSYEHQRFRNNRIVVFDNIAGFTPTPQTQEAFDFFRSLEGPFKLTNDADGILGRIDYEISSNHRTNVRYSYSRNEAINGVSTGNDLFPNTTRALSNNGIEKNNTNTVVGQLSSFFSSNFVNETRAQYSRERRPRLSNSELPETSSNIGTFGARNFLPTTQFDWRFQVADSLTYTRGNHTFKFGGEYNHVFVNQLFGFGQFGEIAIAGGTTAANLDLLSFSPTVTGAGTTVNRFDTTAVTYRRQIGNLLAEFDTDELAFFGQDAWRIRPNLTINYGLRWEGQYNPEPEANNSAVIDKIKGFRFPSGHVVDPTKINDSTNQFGPRFGFAWDPANDGKTVIRGYSGIYYSRTPLLILADPVNNFRNPPGNVRIQLPFSTASLPTTDPRRTCTTIFCQFNLIGVNLNSASLGALPILSLDQIQNIARALGLNPDPFLNASVTLVAPDFKNPKATQAGLGVERELMRGFTVGADFSYIKTVYLQRNRDVNLPAPGLLAGDVALRPFFGLRGATGRPAIARPIPTLGQIQIRESTGKSLYRALTLRAKFQRSRLQFNAFYTRSKNLSDDDNERDAGGVVFENAFDLGPEYNFARLDRKHQFVASPLVTLPFLIEVSSAIRLFSGLPIDVSAGGDFNEDIAGPDRPYRAPGIPFERNAFRNRPQYNVDLRVQKRFNLGAETRRLLISMEIFNVFNLENIQFSGAAVTNYCATTTQRDCGFLAPSNPNFLSLRDLNPNSTRFGSLLTGNNPGSPFQMQLGARFTF